MVFKACFVHWRGCVLGHSYAKIPELTNSWCSIWRTVRMNSLVDHGGFPLCAAINLSRRSIGTPVIRYTVNWWPFTTVWIYSHPNQRCFLFALRSVLQTIFQSASWRILWVTALAELWWTHWGLRSGCVPMSDIFDEAPANQLDLDPLWPGWGCCVSMIYWCEI